MKKIFEWWMIEKCHATQYENIGTFCGKSEFNCERQIVNVLNDKTEKWRYVSKFDKFKMRPFSNGLNGVINKSSACEG